MSQSYSSTESYSVADIQCVIRKITADFIMIAESSKAVEVGQVKKWAHDVELLACNGYLKHVDLTLLSNNQEIRAIRYAVNSEAGDLKSSRAGGVLWPIVPNPFLRIVISYTKSYDQAARDKLRSKLKISWTSSTADTSHSSLNSSAGRDYASNGYGVQRQDFSL
ncbi:hypothetical protein KKI90_19075 [Xenorhabdus bovienii]|uniref:HORMA-1 domain-containing protein n=1 Tax=Xenorhabdus bovienii TaxID=40576 RepID=UPI00237CE66F|nr:hypothetical protein [Xenorhabdus bovienii]MDE1488344.1 hypothetical protein [Xenorhabdus bovienii]MDE1496870.1 hypothetical protein [Xenorhabdus bovienii]MDE9474757.1 hypothetical protein [Xenorhabdus bovienii]MDE9479252.1 hypothetical protein [Xenorhabdus bovienii]MDE9532302.1 hypothetical protein [Xenorhabdus bovienii]